MEEIVNGIVLRAVDYKDSDKIITLFTIEKGIITAGAKGVKKAGAKLKFARRAVLLCRIRFSKKIKPLYRYKRTVFRQFL